MTSRINPPVLDVGRDPEWAYRIRETWANILLSALAPAMRRRGREYHLLSQDGQPLLSATVHSLVMHKGYAFDGCSCWPDGKRLPGCAIHDALRQAVLEDPCCPWNRREADRAFYEALLKCGVSKVEAFIMYRAVAGPIGWAYSSLRGQGGVAKCGGCDRCGPINQAT